MVDSRKRARVEEEDGGGGGGDRIGGLCDELLHQIFSFLPTRDVVQICLLSKRWGNLWCSIPWLDFDEETFRASSSSSSSSSSGSCSSSRTDQLHAAAAAGSSFSKFVNYALKLRDASSNIEKLRLCCSSDNTTSSSNHVFQYIVAALKHNLQLLDLKILHHHPAENVLPSSLFTCQSLTCLKLNNVVLPTYNYSSLNICCLKTLHLISVKFPSNKLSTESLFKNSRNLETLTIRHCNFEHLESFNLCASKLKNLIIIEDEVPPSSTKISKLTYTGFFVPNLTSLQLHLPKQSKWYFIYCKLLVEADIHFKRQPLSKEHILFSNIIEILKQLKNVRAITLSASSLQAIGEKIHLPSLAKISFHNLKFMKLTTSFEESEVRGITHILKCSPNIETLVIEYNSESSYQKNKRLPLKGKKLPSEYTLHHLKTIQMSGFGGRKNEVELLTLLLENAKSLKKMIVEETSIYEVTPEEQGQQPVMLN